MAYDIEEGILYIFTDGSSRPIFNKKLGRKAGRHGGVGIWFIYIDKNFNTQEEDKSEYISYTGSTNQDMEIQACIDGLKFTLKRTDLENFSKIIIVSDSQFVTENIGNALYGNRDKRSWKTIGGDPITHKKGRKELRKHIHKMYTTHNKKVSFDRTKGHSDDKNNEKADKSAVKGAQSSKKTKISNTETRPKLFKNTIWSKNGFIPIDGEKILIHIYTRRLLHKKWYKYNYEIVDQNNKYFKHTGWIYYNKGTLSSKFVYLVKIKINDDENHQIEKIISKDTKEKTIKNMIKTGVSKNIFI